jgi:hypothetical protein
VDFTEPAEVTPIREAVRALCERFGDAYPASGSVTANACSDADQDAC